MIPVAKTYSSDPANKIKEEIKEVEDSLSKEDGLSPLHRSHSSKLGILQKRLLVLENAHTKIAYIDAELERVEEEIKLIKEQAVMSKDPQILSNSIDNISISFGETNEWVKGQEALFAPVSEIMTSVPTILDLGIKETRDSSLHLFSRNKETV